MKDAYDIAHEQLWREFLHKIAQPEWADLLWTVIKNAPERDREEFLAGLQEVIGPPHDTQRLVRALLAIVNDRAQIVADRDAQERSMSVDVLQPRKIPAWLRLPLRPLLVSLLSGRHS